MLGLGDVVAARAVVDRYLPRAPIERSPYLSQLLDADILLKIETFKPTRTFKVRGALNKIASLDDAARARGVVAASAGSHAQGVSYAAWRLGAPATVVGYFGPATLYVEFTGVDGTAPIKAMPPGQVVVSVVPLPMVRNTGRVIFKITLSHNAPFDAYYLSGARLIIDVT